GSDGGWMLVDTGLGLPGAEERWAPILTALDGPVTRIVVTHFHPDHVGDSAVVAELTSAPVFQGADDYAQCRRIWGEDRQPARYAAHVLAHGLPESELDELRRESDALAQLVHAAASPEPLEPGEAIDGWEVVHLPGHADGHLALLRDGILLAGDALLARISPVVGLYPGARPDTLGVCLGTLEQIVGLAPAVASAGPHEPVDDPAARAFELLEHHRRRLDETGAALSAEPSSGYEVSRRLFGPELAST